MAFVSQSVFPAVDRMAGSLPSYVKYLKETTEPIFAPPPSLKAFPGMDYMAPGVLIPLVELCEVFWDDYNSRVFSRLNGKLHIGAN